ncbi:metallophosphoesterase family protein [Pseudobacteriovorax antillogorgiicola]|uniref:Putative phosphoesterase n=1 Tax=Pseudobacteriovorax antillogorgiicola TaxID=1513793 RepID=A0A1Y6CCU5_9BACT|nr:metallophosphoesterase family protein [Pseudobacteriovorax antillogorgiicola]TCS48241.1 putative phosphoesterase [Pseudobacteriovorax antillogorgiicola]SMF57288.1 putative phosphoesterase [Pseudobacteriovorax antillogorgiicola]
MRIYQTMGFLIGTLTLSSALLADQCLERDLRFSKDRTFKIMQITDTQDDHCIDSRTVELISKAITTEKPNLVVFTGDIIASGDITPEDVRVAINNVIHPVEQARVPFLVAFGNHDEDSSGLTGIYEPQQLQIYRSYSCNRNQTDDGNSVTGTGETVSLIKSSDSDKPAFAVWTLDSGRYAPSSFAGQSINQESVKYDNKWDWIRSDQVQWYVSESKKIEKSAGRKIPGLMYFHIPLPEHEYMWDIDAGWVYPDGYPTHPGKQRDKHSLVGERNECVCTGPFNSGLFSAMVDRGDVKGVFVGHDHINSYHGNYFGILLGYGASAGFGTYGFSAADRHRLRGVRIFEISEDRPHKINTRMVLASDLGVNTHDSNQYNNFPKEYCEKRLREIKLSPTNSQEFEIKQGRAVGPIVR